MGYWDETRKCKMCKQEFTVDRSSRRATCSDTCRKQWSRRKENLTAARDGIMLQLGHYRRAVKEHPDLQPLILEQLRFLQGEIRDIIGLRPDEEELQRRAMVYEVTKNR